MENVSQQLTLEYLLLCHQVQYLLINPYGFESLALHQEFRETGNRKYMNLANDEHLVRLHIGLEDPNDLIADIKQAIRHLK